MIAIAVVRLIAVGVVAAVPGHRDARGRAVRRHTAAAAIGALAWTRIVHRVVEILAA